MSVLTHLRDTQPQSPAAPRQISLRWRMTAALSLVLLSVLIMLGIGATYFAWQTEREVWRSRQREAANNAAQTISAFIDRSQNNLILVGLLDPAWLHDQPRYLEGVLDQAPGLLEIIRLDPAGQVLASAHRDQAVLANLFTIAQARWFSQAISGLDYLGGVQLDSTSEPYLILSVPAPEGGVVAARLSMAVLWEIADATRFGESGATLIVDEDGKVLAHPNRELVLTSARIDPATLAGALTAAAEGWRGQYTSIAGDRVTGFALPIPNTAWITITEVSQSEAQRNTRTAMVLFGGGLIVLVLAAVLMSRYVLSRYIFAPLDDLQAGTERLRQGDFGHTLTVHRNDELGHLVHAFNEMSAAIQRRDKELRAQAQELRVATVKAKEAARIRSEFLANVSHELRTPLNAIIGFSDMLLSGMSGELNPKQHHKIERLRENGHRLLNLVNNVLDLTRIEARRVELITAPFSPRALCERLGGQMEALAVKQGLHFGIAIDPALPDQLLGDEQRIEQIVVNLLSNAFKFTERGSVTLRTQVHRAQQTWSLAVIDTGIGIPPHAKDVIFEEFRQLDGSSTRAFRGTGLGLAIARNLVQIMGGQIEVQSELGVGSTFTVVLPLVEPEDPQRASLPQLEIAGA